MSESRKPRRTAREADEVRAFEVGYRRPPVANRFRPGQCGNPKGRPRKAKSLAAEIERELDAKMIVREGRIVKKLPKRAVISRQLADSACRGDLRAARTINDIVSRYSASGIGTPIALPPPPLDQSDLAIIAAFAALVRSGGVTADEPMALGQVQLCALPAEEDETMGPSSTGSAML